MENLKRIAAASFYCCRSENDAAEEKRCCGRTLQDTENFNFQKLNFFGMEDLTVDNF